MNSGLAAPSFICVPPCWVEEDDNVESDDFGGVWFLRAANQNVSHS